jgi:DNA replication licensing factor MCM3
VSPRQLVSSSLRQLVCVEGVATKVSTVKPKVVRSVHYCPETKKHTDRDYVDATDPLLGLELKRVDYSGNVMPSKVVNITTSVQPTKDENGNALEQEFGLSVYKDYQTITLQEMPEKAPMGQLPRSVELVLEHDLVDRIKPGDRVMIVGVFRALATASNSGQQSTSGVFRTVVLVNTVQILGRDVSHLTFSTHDVRTIRSLAKRPDILSVLGRSISPSIHGHAVIKKALALQLLSGVEKNLENGTHLRGDINILMVGDPSTAKSQLLRSAMMIAPLAVSTTGKGSSGVGLTAAVTTDPDTRERRLEAGAMVLADRGLVCVDEFDKMGENDRVAIHEAMEQQTVTIAKAGIHASLNARCSVLAAANPVYGQYDRRRRIQENIGLPDSLLSRFDLLFVVLDQIDPELDRRIATHVVRGHRYRGEAGQVGHDSDYDDDDSDDDDAYDDAERAKVHSVWQRNRHQTASHGDEKGGDVDDDDPHSQDVLQHEFLRKFLHFAKTRIQPVLTESAREFIVHRYAEMRARQDERTLPITARSLETVIRLASAHAKARLSDTVQAEPDCEVAMDILSFALYHENTNNVEEENGKDNGATATVAGEIPPAVSESDTEESGDGQSQEERPNKRPRLDNVDSALSSAQKVLQARILSELNRNDGMMSVKEMLTSTATTTSGDAENVDAQAMMQQAIDALSQQDKIDVTDGMVYSLMD